MKASPTSSCFLTFCDLCGHPVSARSEEALFHGLMAHQDAKHG